MPRPSSIQNRAFGEFARRKVSAERPAKARAHLPGRGKSRTAFDKRPRPIRKLPRKAKRSPDSAPPPVSRKKAVQVQQSKKTNSRRYGQFSSKFFLCGINACMNL